METKTKEKSRLAEMHQGDYCVVLHNDDYNSFQYVVECLRVVCDIPESRGLQIATTVHINGECVIANGDKTDMVKISNQLNIRRLNSKVEEK